MNKVVRFEINLTNRYNFLLISLRLPISKDIRIYIANTCFYEYPVDDKFYRELGKEWSEAEKKIYESIKGNTRAKFGNVFNSPKIICGIAEAYARCGFDVCVISKTNKYNKNKMKYRNKKFTKSEFEIACWDTNVVGFDNGGKITFVSHIKSGGDVCNLYIFDSVYEGYYSDHEVCVLRIN